MKKLWYLLKLGIKALLRVVFAVISGGEECVVCGQRTFLYPICRECRKTYLAVKDKDLFEERCRICGKELLSTQETCFDCRQKPVISHVDKMLPLFPYRIWNKQLMFMWKSQEIRSLSFFFAKILNGVLHKLNAQVIIPVPPRKGKLQQKGWDQIDELCNLLEYIYGYKVLRILERSTKIQQKKLGREGRLEQIGKAYSVISQSKLQKALKPFNGTLPKKVILLDDVCTTGSTLESCSISLKEAGVEEITGVTLFMVD
ncbi:MAG: ComF family protein [Treponema sp.]|nr:ComF family protein [Treponema sp.]